MGLRNSPKEKTVINHKWTLICLLNLLLLPFLGCGDRPKELPKCWPCSVRVRIGESPLSGCTISLVPVGGGKKYVSTGKADAEGLAVVSTVCGNYREEGTPAGDYKLVVSVPMKAAQVSDAEQAARAKMSTQELKQMAMKNKAKAQNSNPVPEAFRTPETSPVTITVTEKNGNRADIDLNGAK